MKNLTILFFCCLLINAAYSQGLWEWSSPKAISSNTFDNQNAFFEEYHGRMYAVWEKVINTSTTALCMKEFENEYAVERILLQNPGIKYSNPVCWNNQIVFEVDNGTNYIKLQYIFVNQNSIAGPFDIIDQSGDQSNPKYHYNYLFWLYKNAVYVAYYSDTSFISPMKLTSNNVNSMDALGSLVTYTKSQGIQTLLRTKKVQYFDNQWQIQEMDSTTMEHRISDLGVDYNYGSQWCGIVTTGSKTGSIVYNEHPNNKLHYYSTGYNLLDPAIGYHNYFHDDLNPKDFIAYSGDSTGNFDVYTHSPDRGLKNLSNFYADDRNPRIFQKYDVFQQFLVNRIYVVWEAEWPGYKTLYYCSLLYPVGANKKLDPGINIKISPNPLSSQTTISFPIMQNPVVKIYSMLGKEIRNLTGFVYANSIEQVVWDGKDNSGHDTPAGSYLVVVQGTKGVNSKVILKQ